MVAGEQLSFILTFLSYNKATVDSEGIIVDKVMETEYYGGRKMIVEFDSPIILS